MVLSMKKFSKTVIYQKDQMYLNSRNSWRDIANASGYVPSTYATGFYSKNGSKYNKPHVVYANDFEMDIPDDAYITRIKFEVSMKCDKTINVKVPYGNFILYDKTIPDTVKKGETGWYGGTYRVYSNQKISTNWDVVNYVMKEKDIKYKNPVDTVNAMGFGILLDFPDADQRGCVYIRWIRLTVEYELPDPYLLYNGASVVQEEATVVNVRDTKKVTLEFGNKSKASMSNQTLDVHLPFGAELISAKASNSIKKDTSFNTSTRKWNVSGKSGVKNTLVLNLKMNASGLKEISANNETLPNLPKGYFWVSSDGLEDFEGIDIVPSTLQRGEVSCLNIYASLNHPSSTKTIDVTIPELLEQDLLTCSLEDKYYSDEVYLDSYEYVSPNTVRLNLHLEPNTETVAVFKLCFYPRVEGDITITCDGYNFNFNVLPAIIKSIIFNGNDSEYGTIKIESNRIYSQVEGDLYVIPIQWEETDSISYVDPSTFAIDQWTKRKYIGCVEVPYSHYEPKNTFKDKLLDEHYKNKEYIGKECNVDETITLKIKLPKKKVPTIQGLIKIDRPIPVNLVPYGWEGDPLNHRGWAEIYAVDIEQTNPLYYKCDIDLKYITHNIISRFNIFAGSVLNKFSLPNVLENTIISGDDIGDFFEVETDGTYIYDDEEPEVHRNLFSYANQQSVYLKSKSVLASKCRVDMYWDSVKFSENRENNISRIVRLLNESGQSVFEYEYYDYDFSDDIYSCRVMGRVATDDGINPIFNKDNVYLHSDMEYTTDPEDIDYDEEDMDLYGSRTVFELDSNKLTIKEHGFSGAEFTETVELIPGKYYFAVEYKNYNNDADTANVVTWFDFDISELIDNSKLSPYYDKLLVSPYPVPRKKIVFTRESEEGTIYYIENDGGDFSFLLEPFYQYLCGVDLVAEESSIFDFNNSYPIIYVQNGLIRFGINRLNGDLYLDKWDYHSKGYIRTNRFRIDNFDDAEVVTINDDVIVVQVSDISITMWRGRPYVQLQHENEDIHILDNFSQVYADGINDNLLTVPAYWNLANSSNLLPECVGGTKLIKSSCITTSEVQSHLVDLGDLKIEADKDNCDVGEEVVCTYPSIYEDNIVLVSNENVLDGEYESGVFTTSFKEEGVYEIYAVYLGDDATDMDVSNKLIINVKYPEDSPTGYVLTYATKAKTFKYGQGIINFKLSQNGTGVSGKLIDIFAPNNTWHNYTNAEGLAGMNIKGSSPVNGIKAGTHTLTATYLDNQELIAQCQQKITIKKSTPVIKGSTLSLKKGEYAGFRIEDESGEPLEGVTLTITIGGKPYTRVTSKKSATTSGGYVSVKMSKVGTFNVKVTYNGEKDRYNNVSEKFEVEVTK